MLKDTSDNNVSLLRIVDFNKSWFGLFWVYMRDSFLHKVECQQLITQLDRTYNSSQEGLFQVLIVYF